MTTNTYIEKKESRFIKVDEMCEILESSPSFAYKVIKDLNKELSDKGYLVVNGKLSRKYFNERFYGKVC